MSKRRTKVNAASAHPTQSAHDAEMALRRAICDELRKIADKHAGKKPPPREKCVTRVLTRLRKTYPAIQAADVEAIMAQIADVNAGRFRKPSATVSEIKDWVLAELKRWPPSSQWRATKTVELGALQDENGAPMSNTQAAERGANELARLRPRGGGITKRRLWLVTERKAREAGLELNEHDFDTALYELVNDENSGVEHVPAGPDTACVPLRRENQRVIQEDVYRLRVQAKACAVAATGRGSRKHVKRGRPVDTNHADDVKLVGDWRTSSMTQTQFETARGLEPRTVHLASERIRDRKRRSRRA